MQIRPAVDLCVDPGVRVGRKRLVANTKVQHLILQEVLNGYIEIRIADFQYDLAVRFVPRRGICVEQVGKQGWGRRIEYLDFRRRTEKSGARSQWLGPIRYLQN